MFSAAWAKLLLQNPQLLPTGELSAGSQSLLAQEDKGEKPDENTCQTFLSTILIYEELRLETACC
jgi:hypothetical protein